MKVHFVGIGGIGLSALARLLKHNNHEVSGSDISQTTITDKQKKRVFRLLFLTIKPQFLIKI